MLEGDVTAGQMRALWPNLNPATASSQPIADDPSDSRGGHLLARWTQARSGGGSLQIQSFVDIGSRDEPVGHYHGKTFDVDTQYHTALGARHDLVMGAGYRFDAATFAGGVGFSLTPPDDRSSLFTAFVRDDIALAGNRLVVTVGGQVQHDSRSGVGVQPTARLIWKALPNQTVWAATSRALRTPSLYERGIQVDQAPVPSPAGLPLVVRGIGNPHVETETLVETEAGYRLESGTAWSIDVTGFVGRYNHLRTSEVAAPIVQFVPSPRILVTSQFGNQLEAATHGLEVVGRWTPLPAWRVDGSYTFFHLTPRLAAGSLDPLAASEDGSAPGRQWQLRSAFSPGTRATVNLALFHVGRLEQLQVAAYTRADVSAEWRFSNRLSAMVTGQNLFDAAHAEFGGAGSFLLVTQVPRSAGVRLRWTFR